MNASEMDVAHIDSEKTVELKSQNIIRVSSGRIDKIYRKTIDMTRRKNEITFSLTISRISKSQRRERHTRVFAISGVIINFKTNYVGAEEMHNSRVHRESSRDEFLI